MSTFAPFHPLHCAAFPDAIQALSQGGKQQYLEDSGQSFVEVTEVTWLLGEDIFCEERGKETISH